MKFALHFSLLLSVFNLCASCASLVTLPSYTGPYYVEVRVEPIVVTDLGDRVTGPARVLVDAPGATHVEIYLQPLDQPYSGKVIGDPKFLGKDKTPSDGFSIPWQADEPYDYVQIYAIAYGQSDVNYSRTSLPITILLDWRIK